MNKGKWKLTKFWGHNAFDKFWGHNAFDKFWGHNAFDEMGWKYEVGYHTEDDVEYTEYFDDKEHAKEYLEECKGERK